MCPTFDICAVTLSTYKLTMAIGFIVTAIGSLWIAPKYKLDRWHVLRLFVVCFFFVLLGSSLLYFFTDGLYYFTDYLKNRGNGRAIPFKAMFGGFRFFGGLFFALLGGWIYTRVAGLKYMSYMPVFVVFAPLGVAIGRIGCFCAGCCYGLPYEGILSVTFPHTGPVHPLQLYESAGYFLIFIVLLCMFFARAKQIYIGSAFVFLISALRFAAEYLRADARWILPWLSINQMLAIAAVLFIVIINIVVKLGENRSIKEEGKNFTKVSASAA